MKKSVRHATKVAKPRAAAVASAQEVKTAATTCRAELLRGAEPLQFSEEALAALQARYGPAFRVNLPRVGGWQKADPVLRRVAFYLGVIARDIATFNRAPQIELDHARVAQNVIESECQLAADGRANGREGLICSDIDDIQG